MTFDVFSQTGSEKWALTAHHRIGARHMEGLPIGMAWLSKPVLLFILR